MQFVPNSRFLTKQGTFLKLVNDLSRLAVSLSVMLTVCEVRPVLAQIDTTTPVMQPVDTAVVNRRLRDQEVALRSIRERKLQTEKNRFQSTLRQAGISDATLARLRTAGVETFQGLGSKKGRQLMGTLSPASKRAIANAAGLSLVSSDPNVVTALARSRLNSASRIAQATIRDIASNTGGRLDTVQARVFKQRARVVRNLIHLQARRFRASSKNPSSFYSTAQPVTVSGGSDEAAQPVSTGPETPAEGTPSSERSFRFESLADCNPDQNVFSPGAYLIHLLDFVEKSFGNDLNSLAKINSWFHQRFEDLPLSQGSEDEVSNVELSNRILENLITELDGNQWPNANITWGWADLHRRPPDPSTQRRIAVYGLFGNQAYQQEPGFAPRVLIDLFERYVREFGTTRTEADLVRRSNTLHQDNFAERRGLTTADLAAIDIDDASVSIASIWSLADHLLTYFQRAQERAFRAERTADIGDSLRIVFSRALRTIYQQAADQVLLQLVPNLQASLSADEFETQLLRLRGSAFDCIRLGQNCPSGSPYIQHQITPLRELFRYFQNLDPARDPSLTEDQYLTRRLVAIQDDLTQQRLTQLINEELDPQAVTPARRDELRVQATQYATEHVGSEEVLDLHIDSLAQQSLILRLNNSQERQRFNAEVLQRATAEWKTAISRAEAGLVTKLRHNLIVIALNKLSNAPNPPPLISRSVNGRNTLVTDENIELLANLLFLDLTVTESHKTTPLAFAIGRLQTFVQAVRLGTDTRVRADQLNEPTWAWLKSYGTWHAVMMVSVYPENFLIPEIRRYVTVECRTVMDSFAGQLPRQPEAVLTQYAEKIGDIGAISIIAAVPWEDNTFLLGSNGKSVYYSVLGARDRWRSWQRLDGLQVTYPPLLRVGFAPASEEFRAAIFFFSFRPECIAGAPCSKWKQVLRYAAFSVSNDSLVPLSAPGWTEVPDKAPESRSYQFVDNLLVLRSFGSGYTFMVNRVLNGLYNQPDGSRPGLERLGVAFEANGQLKHVYLDTLFGSYGNVAAIKAAERGVALLWSVGGSLYLETDGRSMVVPAVGPGSFGVLVPGSNGHRVPLLMYPSSLELTSLGTDGRSVVVFEKSGNQVLLVQHQQSAFTQIATYTYAVGTSYSRWTTGVVLGDRVFVFGRGGSAPTFADGGRLTGAGSLTEPLRLAVPTEWPERTALEPTGYAITTAADPARVYLDEYFLYLPLWLAEQLREAGRHEDALRIISRVYDPVGATDADRERYPAFHELNLGARQIDLWLADPFNPYAMANVYKAVYLAGVKFAHVANLLEWADRLFAQDSPESVNRARELYELAAAILKTIEWTTVGSVANGSMETVGEVITSADDEALTLAELELLGLTPETVGELGSLTITTEIPDLGPLCLPPNPLLMLYRWRIEANLAKIRNNQNLAGMERKLQPYAVPVDPTKLVRQAASGGIDFEETVPTAPPPIYRYQFLLDRARQLAGVANQFEHTMLSSIEKGEEADYTALRARQELVLERGNVVLRNLQLQGANQERVQAEAQKQRYEFSRDHFLELIGEGLNAHEEKALEFLKTSLWLPASVSVSFSGGSAGWSVGGSISYSPSDIMKTWANIFSTQASYERREQEWQYQADMADHDIRLADIGIGLSETHVSIAEQEQSIAQQRSDFARDNVEFLASRFTSGELYQWMSRALRHLYKDQLNLAISTAKAAQRALAFERQTSFDIIGFDYWDDSRRGLLSAERLLQDIDKLEQFRLSTDQRRREIETVISLASVAPVELQRFQETGVIEFASLSSWFDRQFPGHYMRLIKSVSASVFALVPPNEGIRATLSNPGISRVVTGPPFSEEAVIYRLPEAVALSTASNATGLFELRFDDPLLFPFEGNGVATTWRLEMSKGANPFDYSTIADILFKIRYTALEDRSYREQVLQAMEQDESGYVPTEARRAFSLRQNFPDEWYALKNNPPATQVKPRVDPRDFLANEEGRRIRKVTAAVQWASGPDPTSPVPFEIEFTPDSAVAPPRTTMYLDKERTFSTTQDFNGRAPYGIFAIKVGGQQSALDALEDILIVIDYKAKVHYPK